MSLGSGLPTLLLVDDDRNTRDGLTRALRRHFDVKPVESGERALEVLSDAQVDVMLTDVRMPGMDGMTLLTQAQKRHPGLICVLITAYGNVEMAVEAMKHGAYDFLTKPVNLDHLELLLQRALRSRRVEQQNRQLQEELHSRFGMENIIGRSRAMEDVFDIVRQAAPTQATVLIQGPSGTGKELVAHALHHRSTRADGPFVAVHCAALSSTLLESELFGHEKGAFTGAAARRKGRFEMAHGGTLFLDEVSEIEMAVQVKLLRVLEERRFERVGGDTPVDVDIRLVAATNRDLKQHVRDGKFREDLFFRLDVVSVQLPALATRTDDIPLLCEHFLKEFSERNGRDIDGFTPDAMTMLAAYSWPGNVRELRNTVEKMVVLTRNERLTARDVPPNIRDEVREQGIGVLRTAPAGLTEGSLAETERSKIFAVLRKHNDNRTQAAEELGISRRTLHRKLRRYQDETE